MTADRHRLKEMKVEDIPIPLTVTGTTERDYGSLWVALGVGGGKADVTSLGHRRPAKNAPFVVALQEDDYESTNTGRADGTGGSS